MHALFAIIFLGNGMQSTAQEKHVIKNLKITILSTMLAQQGIGEWGFCALVEADSIKILFDAGARENTVLQNAKEMKIDLSKVRYFVLSHDHDDHTTGWLPIRRAMKPVDPYALSVTHVGYGIFDTRIFQGNREFSSLRKDSAEYVQNGGNIVVHKNFDEIFPGIFITGPVPRTYPEKNYPPFVKRKDPSGMIVDDNVPEDMSLIIYTEKGLVMLSGCGHSGIINTITYVRKNLPGQPVIAAIGGFHLFMNTDEQIKWTAEQIKNAGVRYFMGAHCTGIEPVYQIREWAGLKRGECIVGSVGAAFDIERGFNAGPLAK
jgi:7,8-dihydropterin-6-yl-methyl-4-(beta-D-ribofuranosyl)aminobenzene 5'-phosphate synthase